MDDTPVLMEEEAEEEGNGTIEWPICELGAVEVASPAMEDDAVVVVCCPKLAIDDVDLLAVRLDDVPIVEVAVSPYPAEA